MAFCMFSKDAGLYDSTPIENLFLTEYLASAPADCLRVYLCVRMLSLHPELGADFDSLPDMLRLSRDAVTNAMTYWEREGLLRRVSDNPPSYELLPARKAEAAADPMEKQYYEYRDFNASLQQLFGMEHLLHPKEYAAANDWITVFGLTQEAVLALVEEGLKLYRAKKPETLFKRLDEFVRRHSEDGIRTREDALYIMHSEEADGKLTARLLKKLGITRLPTSEETKLVRKWLEEWHLDEKQIQEALADTTKSRNPSMAYLDSILASRMSGEDEAFGLTKDILAALGSMSRPTPDETSRVRAYTAAGFEPATLTMIANLTAGKNRRRFEDFAALADQFAALKLYAAADADAYVQAERRKEEDMRALMLAAGIDKRPGRSDMNDYNSWIQRFPREVLTAAAGYAKGTRLPLKYMRQLLDGWERAGVRTADEARAAHEAHTASASASSANRNPALNYAQRPAETLDYSHLLFDPSEFPDEEEKK